MTELEKRMEVTLRAVADETIKLEDLPLLVSMNYLCHTSSGLQLTQKGLDILEDLERLDKKEKTV